MRSVLSTTCVCSFENLKTKLYFVVMAPLKKMLPKVAKTTATTEQSSNYALVQVLVRKWGKFWRPFFSPSQPLQSHLSKISVQTSYNSPQHRQQRTFTDLFPNNALTRVLPKLTPAVGTVCMKNNFSHVLSNSSAPGRKWGRVHCLERVVHTHKVCSVSLGTWLSGSEKPGILAKRLLKIEQKHCTGRKAFEWRHPRWMQPWGPITLRRSRWRNWRNPNLPLFHPPSHPWAGGEPGDQQLPGCPDTFGLQSDSCPLITWLPGIGNHSHFTGTIKRFSLSHSGELSKCHECSCLPAQAHNHRSSGTRKVDNLCKME